MKRFFLVVFCGLMLLPNLSCAQKTDTEPVQTKPVQTKAAQTNKLYSQMSDDEKLRFVGDKSDEVLALFGRAKGDEINEESLKAIKNSLDAYVGRIAVPNFDSCASRDWVKSDLTSVLKRGSSVSTAISEEFSAQNLPPALGIYVAMIETEFCPCLQSPIGTLGMYQWTVAAGADYGLKTQKGATTAKPDERCEPQPAARAASKYLKKLTDQIFGNDAVGIPLAISSFNRGEGWTKIHLADVKEISNVSPVSFWVLMDTQEKLIEKFEKDAAKKTKPPVYIEQFQLENAKYVTKFFAAAIIGENPKTFGIDLPPLSRTK